MTDVAEQATLLFNEEENPKRLLPNLEPTYITNYGSAYTCDALSLLKSLPERSVNTVITSPPYALHFQKEYKNASKEDKLKWTKEGYIAWFLPFAEEIKRILTDDGSFVLNIGGSYNKGSPTRSLYHFKLLIALVEEIGLHLAQECFWFNPAKMPVPAEWVTVRRIRIRDSVEYVWWFSKTEWPKATNRNVLRPYSKDMKRLNEKGLKQRKRPGGYTIKPSFSEISAGGSIPPNVIEEELAVDGTDEIAFDMLKFGNNAANDRYTKRCKEAGVKPHPARFPAPLPEFFIKLLTEPSDMVLDPFAGSNTTGAVAERLQRHWLACDHVDEYVTSSEFRFEP